MYVLKKYFNYCQLTQNITNCFGQIYIDNTLTAQKFVYVKSSTPKQLIYSVRTQHVESTKTISTYFGLIDEKIDLVR